MDWVMIGGAVMAVWAAGSFVGNERQRRIETAEAEAANAAAPAAPPIPTPADPAATH